MAQLMKKPLVAIFSVSLLLVSGVVSSADPPVKPSLAEMIVNQVRKAAEQGDPEDQYNLGRMYRHGNGMARDNSSAVKWFYKAAVQGHSNAQNNLGLMYKNGQGALQNHQVALEWFRKAANQGNAHAECNLGIMYDNGLGISQDRWVAVEWYRKAAQQGDSMAKQRLQQLGHH